MEVTEPIILESSWVPPTYDIPRRDLFTEFIITVVFPLGLALLLFLILSIIMFGRRTGLEKRNAMTPESQLAQFDTIRRATTNLRYMSQRRDGPSMTTSPRPATSAPNIGPNIQHTLEPRGQSLPPPAYRVTPNISPASTLPRTSSSRHGSQPGDYGAEHSQDTLRIRPGPM